MITDLKKYAEDLMVLIEGGSFMMGSEHENAFYNNIQEVVLNDLMMAKFPFT